MNRAVTLREREMNPITLDTPFDRALRYCLPLATTKVISALAILAVAAIIVAPIFMNGFPDGDDASVHYLWTSEFASALREGVLYPRWLAGLNHGKGSPAMNYYPPLPYYAMSFFQVITGGVNLALALGCWLALALSGLSMRAFSSLFVSRRAALAAAILYMAAPYHLFDLYQRSAVAEFWAFVWLPLVLFLVYRVITRDDWRYVAYLSLAFFSLLMTHLLSAIALSLLLPIYVLLLTRNPRRIGRIAASLALGPVTGGIFLVPVLLESRYVQLNLAALRRYSDFFLFESSGQLGSGFEPALFRVNHDGRFFLFDTNVIALGVLSLLVLSTIVLWKGKKGWQGLWKSSLYRSISSITVLSFLMTTRISSPIWAAIPALSYIQFPVRWLLITSVGTSLLAIAAFWPPSRTGRPSSIHIGALAVAMIFNITLSALIVSRAPFKPGDLANRIARNKEVAEYTTIWSDINDQPNQALASFVIESGDASVHIVDDSGTSQRYIVTATKQSDIMLRPFYFPGWVARVHGKPVDLRPSATGQILLTIEPGEYNLALDFDDTTPRTAGKLVSACGLLALLGLFCVSQRKRRKLSTARLASQPAAS